MTCTKEEAAAAVRGAAFAVDDLDSRDYGRRIVHCFRGIIGADWDEDAVIRRIAKSDEIQWIKGFAHHDLAVHTPDDGWNCFQVLRPEVTA